MDRPGSDLTCSRQAYDGASFNPSDPAGSIRQMINDGAVGTSKGPGLKQAFDSKGNWYSAFRKYNSGSVNAADLNDPRGATGDYVQKVANRLVSLRLVVLFLFWVVRVYVYVLTVGLDGPCLVEYVED